MLVCTDPCVHCNFGFEDSLIEVACCRGNRKRLTRELFEVPRTRLDLLPFYSRTKRGGQTTGEKKRRYWKAWWRS